MFLYVIMISLRKFVLLTVTLLIILNHVTIAHPIKPHVAALSMRRTSGHRRICELITRNRPKINMHKYRIYQCSRFSLSGHFAHLRPRYRAKFASRRIGRPIAYKTRRSRYHRTLELFANIDLRNYSRSRREIHQNLISKSFNENMTMQ